MIIYDKIWNMEFIGYHLYENIINEIEIINLQWLDKEKIDLIFNDIDNMIDLKPYKIIVKINTIDCKEYDYDINILYDVAENFLNYYSVKIQFIKK